MSQRNLVGQVLETLNTWYKRLHLILKGVRMWIWPAKLSCMGHTSESLQLYNSVLDFRACVQHYMVFGMAFCGVLV